MLRRLGYVIVFVRDMSRAVAFYRDRLGLVCRAESAHWSELELEGTTLALHLGEDLPSAPPPAEDPGSKRGVAIELVFHADDPLQLRDRLAAAGVRFSPPKIVHEAGPDQVGVSCLFEDPDGNLLSLYGIVPRASLTAE
jgi:extradiol dioxygenase family protein